MPRARDRGGGAWRRRRISPRRGGSRSPRATAARSGLLLCHKPNDAPSAARTRWRIAPAPSVPDEFGGLGRTAFTLSLLRNRRGPCGTWTLTWDHHEHAFAALSLGVAEAAFDRPDRERSAPAEPLVIVAPIKSALRLSAVNDAAAALRPEGRHGARRRARDASEDLRSRMRTSRPTSRCSKRSPTGATAIRRWSGSIRRRADARHLGLRASVRRRGGARARS